MDFIDSVNVISRKDQIQMRQYNCLTRYIRKTLRRMHPQMTINSLAVHEIDNLLKDVFQQIGEAAGELLETSDRVTIRPSTLAKACRLVLPRTLSYQSRRVAKEALMKYHRSM